MLAIAASIILAAGWRRRLIALAAGATGALAMAPFNFFPALAIPMTVAVWLIDGCAETRKMLPGRRFRLGLPVAAWRAFSRRGGRIRLGLAAGGCRAARRTRDFSGPRLPAGAAYVGARPGTDF